MIPAGSTMMGDNVRAANCFFAVEILCLGDVWVLTMMRQLVARLYFVLLIPRPVVGLQNLSM